LKEVGGRRIGNFIAAKQFKLLTKSSACSRQWLQRKCSINKKNQKNIQQSCLCCIFSSFLVLRQNFYLMQLSFFLCSTITQIVLSQSLWFGVYF